jgi:guanylate kinase
VADGEQAFHVLVLSGPSGTGKTTIVERLLRQAPIKLVKCVSATTRPRRVGEEDGEAYYFLKSEEFAARKAAGEFLETAEVFGAGYWYGTLKSELDRARQLGGWAFLEIDVQGALNVMAEYPDAITIFLKPPSIEVCEQRLRSRGTDSEETIQRRLRKVQDELLLADRYRYQVVNDNLEDAVERIIGILSEYRGDLG